MAIFGDDGQVGALSLSDEAIYADEERQDEEQLPLAEPDDAIEAEDHTSGDDEAEDSSIADEDGATEDDSDAEAPNGQAEALANELASLRQQYDNLRKWTTQTAMRNSELQRQIEQTQNSSQPAQTPEQVEEAKKAFLRDLLENPNDLINKAVEERVAEVLRPIMAERQRMDINRRVGEAIDDVATGWSQARTEDGKQAVVKKMFELAAQTGNATAWQEDPSKYAIAACRSLWGWPSHVDASAIEAARKAAVQAAREQLPVNKEGLYVNQNSNKQQNKELSPEETILAEMRSTMGGGLFD